MLEKRILEKGMDLKPLKFYVESFKHGVSPHAGAGIGLERVVFLYLGKYCTVLFCFVLYCIVLYCIILHCILNCNDNYNDDDDINDNNNMIITIVMMMIISR